MSSPAAELCARVERAAEGTPYQVTATDDGFEVSLDLPDVRWHSLMSDRGLRQAFTHRVKIVDEQARKLAITDELYQLEWSAGVPRIGASVSKQSGRVWTTSFGVSTADGWALDSEEGRALVGQAAEQLGWTTVRGTQEKIGLVAAVVGAGGAVVTLVALLVAFLVRSF